MSCRECREVSRFILLGLTVLGWIFSLVSVAHCSFVQVAGVNVGLFKGGYEGGSCVKYGSAGRDVSTAMQTARAFGVLLTLATSFAMILVIVVVLFYPNKIMWNVYRVLLSLSYVFNMFTFVLFAECADFESLQGIFNVTCSVGGASVCAILNSFLLLATSILSCCTPLHPEPVFKNLSCGNTSTTATNNNNVNEIITRTVEETPEGKKITEEVTDANGNKTVTTTFEPLDSVSDAMEGFNVGPTVKTVETELPNGKRIVEEDAHGNKTITTKIVVMAGEESNAFVGQAPPQDSGDVVMAAAVPVPVSRSRQSYQSEDEERGMANPYLSSTQGARYSDRNPQGNSSSSGSRSSRSGPSSRPDSVEDSPMPHHESFSAYNSKGGGPDSGVTALSPPQTTYGYAEDSESSAFTDSGNYDDSFNTASSGAFDSSFMDSSANFDNSFAPGDSGALDGTGERKPRKKKKKKKHHKHRSEHRESSKRPKRPKESREVATGADVEAAGEE